GPRDGRCDVKEPWRRLIEDRCDDAQKGGGKAERANTERDPGPEPVDCTPEEGRDGREAEDVGSTGRAAGGEGIAIGLYGEQNRKAGDPDGKPPEGRDRDRVANVAQGEEFVVAGERDHGQGGKRAGDSRTPIGHAAKQHPPARPSVPRGTQPPQPPPRFPSDRRR